MSEQFEITNENVQLLGRIIHRSGGACFSDSGRIKITHKISLIGTYIIYFYVVNPSKRQFNEVRVMSICQSNNDYQTNPNPIVEIIYDGPWISDMKEFIEQLIRDFNARIDDVLNSYPRV